MTISITAFSDYFQALAVGPQTAEPRPMRDMEEASAFHAEVRGMPETLRLDFEQSGCNHRAELISGLLVSRGIQHGQAIMAYNPEHKDHFECAAYALVETEKGVERVAFPPLSEKPELLPDFEARCVSEGAILEWSIISDGMGGRRSPEQILERLHGENYDVAAP